MLEVMQEHKVTVSGTTYVMQEPFFVLATDNPIEQDGTYPLPEAQMDRFMFKVISTDGGQVENPHWELAEEEYLQYMLDHGIPEEHIRYMSHDLPCYLLGIEA